MDTILLLSPRLLQATVLTVDATEESGMNSATKVQGLHGAIGWVIPLLLWSAAARAESSVEVDGMRYTCSTRCVIVTQGRGMFTVRDCCGGRIRYVVTLAR